MSFLCQPPSLHRPLDGRGYTETRMITNVHTQGPWVKFMGN